MPSVGRPRFVWNLRRASSVNAPKMPSMSPQAKPSAESAFCSCCTSWPWKWGMRRYSVRSPRQNDASTRAVHVFSSTSSPHSSCAWERKDATAFAVSGPNRPSTWASSNSPMRERRCCTSSTAAPESLSLMVSIAPTYFSRFTNQSAMEISMSRDGDGPTFCTKRPFAALVRFSA